MSPEISGYKAQFPRSVGWQLNSSGGPRLCIAIFIVGHVTKEGTLAGPRMLEHMVDGILLWRRHTAFRILRAVKNRLIRQMRLESLRQSGGLVEVLNPSEVFLEEQLGWSDWRLKSIVVTMEGTRPILAEVQTIVTTVWECQARRQVLTNLRSLIMACFKRGASLAKSGCLALKSAEWCQVRWALPLTCIAVALLPNLQG